MNLIIYGSFMTVEYVVNGAYSVNGSFDLCKYSILQMQPQTCFLALHEKDTTTTVYSASTTPLAF